MRGVKLKMLGLIRDLFCCLFGIRKNEVHKHQRVVIYTDKFFRGALVPEEIKKRKPNATFRISELVPWEHHKSPNDNSVRKWVDDILLPELKKNGILKPIVVWRNERNKKNYVIDGHHRLIAYKKSAWTKEIPAVVVRADEIMTTNWTPDKKFPHP
ncbi:hypothetical protein EBT16_13900 [bacterium]|nr:hypothetical protein [bacterium]